MRFLKPSVNIAFFPSILVALAVIPLDGLRYTLYSVLASPLWPIINRLGWVYRDKPQFLTYPAAIFAAVFWALVLYLFLCSLRRMFASHEDPSA